KHKCAVLSSVGLYVSAPIKPSSNQSQHLITFAVLAHVKLRHQLKSAPASLVAVDGNSETTFAIHIARNVAIQSFLLIVRTRHVVTVPAASDVTTGSVARDTRSSQHIARFIDSNVLLSHDVLNPARVPL